MQFQTMFNFGIILSVMFLLKFLSKKIMMDFKHCDVNDNDTYALGNTSFPSKHNV